jgi:hypothetical protein
MAKRIDQNHVEIVHALRAVGASVLSLHTLGKGAPDLLVGFRGCTYLLEVKTLTGKLKDCQVEWHNAWRGHRPQTVQTVGQALAAIGATR